MMYSRSWVAAFAGALAVVTGPALSNAAPKAALIPPATAYAFEGIVYDRLFLGRMHTRAGRAATRIPVRRGAAVAGPPYIATDLFAETGLYGEALAIDDGGDVAYWVYDDYNFLFGDPDVIHDDGTYTTLGEPYVDPYGDAGAIPYALNSTGDVVGVGINEFEYGNVKHFHADWTPTQTYYGYAFDGDYAYAVNDANVSVGQALFSGVPAAAVFSISPSGGDRIPVRLRPPKGTAWIGTATGINDAGEIVGYANQRAVVFNPNGYAQVLPVGAAGVSTSAQAINQRGDIVGNAGAQAFLYRNHRVTYLPRPPGETAGNAVALAINASDEIVGDIVDPATGASTAFLYVNGQSYDLNSLLPANSGTVITDAVGINNAGEIVGGDLLLKPQSSSSSRPLSRARLF